MISPSGLITSAVVWYTRPSRDFLRNMEPGSARHGAAWQQPETPQSVSFSGAMQTVEKRPNRRQLGKQEPSGSMKTRHQECPVAGIMPSTLNSKRVDVHLYACNRKSVITCHSVQMAEGAGNTPPIRPKVTSPYPHWLGILNHVT